MTLDCFYQKINELCVASLATAAHNEQDIVQQFRQELAKTLETVDNLEQKMSSLTVLFEAFYQWLQDDSELKKRALALRLDRWEKHYGVPTLSFLLSYHTHINDIIQTLSLPKDLPSYVEQASMTHDAEQDVIVDVSAMLNIPSPLDDEKIGQFLTTHNPSGGFTTAACDPCSQAFIEYTKALPSHATVLDIGAAFGVASLQALTHGVTLFCNDVSPQNLAVVYQRYASNTKHARPKISGDFGPLVFVPGAFPYELQGLPSDFFDAIFISRVLHFFPGKVIEDSLTLLYRLLKPHGKLFIVCETPFLKNWRKFLPVYEARVANHVPWPGEVYEPAHYESSGRVAWLPPFLHWMTTDVLNKALTEANFHVKSSEYIDRTGQFPDDLIFDGRESVAVIAVKPAASMHTD